MVDYEQVELSEQDRSQGEFRQLEITGSTHQEQTTSPQLTHIKTKVPTLTFSGTTSYLIQRMFLLSSCLKRIRY